jgi:hypothetical protein
MDDPATEAMHEDAVTELLAKDLAIKSALSALDRLPAVHTHRKGTDYEAIESDAQVIIRNLLTGLGCVDVVNKWLEITY